MIDPIRTLLEGAYDRGEHHVIAKNAESWAATLGKSHALTAETIRETIQSIETDRSTKCVPDSAPGDHLEGK